MTRRAITTVRVVGVSAAVVALGVAGMVLTAPAAAQDGRGSGERTADLTEAQVMTFTIETTATGELEARNQIEIRNKLEQQSTIVEVVAEGTMVKEGDLLVALNSDKIEDLIAEEELRVEAAHQDYASADAAVRIQVTDNEAALKNAELEVELAGLALQQWREGDLVKKREQLRVAIEKAERQYKRLEKKLDRSRKLYKEEFLSSNELELDEINFLEAEANLQIARLDLDTYEKYQKPRDEKSKEADVDNAGTKLKKVREQNKINLNNKESTLATRTRQRDMHIDKLEDLNGDLEACTMLAPSDGLVVFATSMERNRWGGGSEGPLQIGRQVYPNELLIVLPDTSQMVASVRVHESMAGRIRPGQTVAVRIDAEGGTTFTGTVESIGVLAESGGWRDPNRREYTVKVLLDNANVDGSLKPSMRCEATISLGTVEDALSVPVQSVFSDGAVRFVYMPKGSKFIRRPIQIGRRSSTYAEISAGLKEGEVVLTREPSPGEVLSTEWDEKELEVAGLTLDEKGQPIAVRRGPPGMPGKGGALGAGTPKAATPTAGAEKTKTVKPASTPGE